MVVGTPVRRIIDVGSVQSVRAAVKALAEVEKDVRAADKRAANLTAKQLRIRVFGAMLRALRRYPPRRKGMHMRWKSDRQRKYVMMLLRARGEADGYIRTGTLARGWQYEVKPGRDGVLRIRVWNDAEQYDPIKGQMRSYARFVQGDVGFGASPQSMRLYTKPIQPFHVDRGWQPAAPIIQRYRDRANELYIEIYEAQLNAALRKLERMR